MQRMIKEATIDLFGTEMRSRLVPKLVRNYEKDNSETVFRSAEYRPSKWMIGDIWIETLINRYEIHIYELSVY